MREAVSRTIGDRADKMWYIDSLATDPENQGQGFGGALLESIAAFVRYKLLSKIFRILQLCYRPTFFLKPRGCNPRILTTLVSTIPMDTLRSLRSSSVRITQHGLGSLWWSALYVDYKNILILRLNFGSADGTGTESELW